MSDLEYRRLAAVLPFWARRCMGEGHNLSLLKKTDGRVEVFCGDCYDGAGRGQTLTAEQTRLLVREWGGATTR